MSRRFTRPTDPIATSLHRSVGARDARLTTALTPLRRRTHEDTVSCADSYAIGSGALRGRSVASAAGVAARVAHVRGVGFSRDAAAPERSVAPAPASRCGRTPNRIAPFGWARCDTPVPPVKRRWRHASLAQRRPSPVRASTAHVADHLFWLFRTLTAPAAGFPTWDRIGAVHQRQGAEMPPLLALGSPLTALVQRECGRAT